MERPSPADRKVSFNPEAAAFSPTSANQAVDGSLDINISEDLTLGSGVQEMLDQNSPFRTTMNMRPAYHVDGNSGMDTSQFGDLIPGGISLADTLSSFGVKPSTSVGEHLGSSVHTDNQAHQGTFLPVAPMPSINFNTRRPEPDLRAVDMDELSASLGLPGAKKGKMMADSPVDSPKLRGTQGISDELYGTLLGKAREKPLTANDLAHLLRNRTRSDTSEETVKAPHEMQDPFIDREQGQVLKVVCPPPGFGNQMPRMVTVEEEHIPAAPAAMLPPVEYAAQFVPLHHHHPNVGQSSTSFQQHTRRHSGRRRPRTHTRTKRTDQGPEPSAADIYPEDADWEAVQPSRQGYFIPPSYQPKPPPALHVGNPDQWPTPAENVNITEAHIAPSHDDMSAADGEVIGLIDELPEASVDTLIRFGAFDLLPEDRPLTPMQESGKRYGMKYYGVGLGDDWDPPAAIEKEPFRVRPREHAGWGGWEWAVRKGWGHE
ncbi:hypothetical protein FB567DRAFT_231467 [Paraphoma chrysanthemicola]|uniref:Uncharacterized protein n=1 Tax=Paraphoma chrysanthemicola TaxID=798071 RepID=A0A8K0W245_9PLEO|nr:hypothetical protein FB567DRAFT_231467 [Paraphoma chrysanthemicola]